MIESSLIREERLVGHIDGYPSTIAPEMASAYDSIASAYAENQLTDNIQKTDRYLLPLVRRIGARTVLDAGCGAGRLLLPKP
jgi:2-polyprenyl-3-methyl-5-hydroxy-6-metoxy-1,4-benzoquinol methylase